MKLNTTKTILTSLLLLAAVTAIFLMPNKSSVPAIAAEAKAECAEFAPDMSCYAKRMAQIAQDHGPQFAFEVLSELQQLDKETQTCHLISHGIGEGTYKRDPANWQKDIRAINRACGYGAMHGIIENYSASLPGGVLSRQDIRDICGTEPFSECNHIVGHLLLVETGAKVDEALGLCDVLQDIPRQVENCYNGAFMEYQTAQNLIEHGLATEEWLNWPQRIVDLESMCRTYDGLREVACWRIIAHAADMTFNHDPARVFSFCDRSPVIGGKRECKRHAIGILTADAKYDFEKLKPMCHIPQAADPEFEKDCYMRLALTTLSTFPDKMAIVKEYCLGIPEYYQADCLEQLD